ncbi:MULTISPECIES: RBBP9/YdeN family alpha/beta hydrolase [Microvirga]|uniref:RBBP9/YdeN family alpha/beta hydrolase n=1 Tax=Microvirga TaxID=186650 RepID=UPI001CFF7D54|nr:alpha/beta hydrolase [Microvirga lenta]MCB5176583.1 alpha/beta hydrolase [Microvirga lenta]
MKTSDCDILIVPGYENSGVDHWQSRWERQLSTARRIEQESWDAPDKEAWIGRIVRDVEKARKPVVLVGHSLGVIAIAHAAPLLKTGKVQGAFLVGLPDVERPDFIPAIDRSFAPIPRDPLPFPSVLVMSRTDPFGEYEKAEDIAYSWGSAIVDAGDAGHINTDSGHGPWPEGLMRFAGFLKRL